MRYSTYSWIRGAGNARLFCIIWLCRNHCHNALSAIERVTPSLPQRGRQPKGASPPLDPQFRSFFSDACLRPFSTGRGSTDPERPWLHHYPILSLTGFLQSLSSVFHKTLLKPVRGIVEQRAFFPPRWSYQKGLALTGMIYSPKIP